MLWLKIVQSNTTEKKGSFTFYVSRHNFKDFLTPPFFCVDSLFSTVFKFTRNKQRKIAKAHIVHFQTKFGPLKVN